MPALCIASCKELLVPADGSAEAAAHAAAAADDRYLYAALRRKKIEFDVKAWDDETVDWEAYKLVLIRTTWDYSESETRAKRFVEWAQRVADLGPRVLNDPAVIVWNHSKQYLKQLGEAGIPVIPTEWFTPSSAAAAKPVVKAPPAGGAWGAKRSFAAAAAAGLPDVARLIRERGWVGAVIKPCVSAGSRGTKRIRGSEGAEGVEAGTSFLRDMITLGFDSSETTAAVASSLFLPVDGPDAPSAEAAAAACGGAGAGAGPVSMVRPGGTAASAFAGAGDAADVDAEGAEHADGGADAGEGSAPAEPPAPAADDPVPRPREASAPCAMMVQPYIPSVETAGELSVIVIDGAISHAIVKKPAPGGFKTQEEFGGQQSRVDITPAEAALVMRVLEASAAAVQRSKAAALAGAAAAGAASMPVEVVRPGDLFPIARVDFLRAPPALRSEAFGSDAASVGDDGGADLLLLELEVIEPCLFFGVDALGQGGPGTANAAAAAAVLGAGADAAAAAAPATSKSAEALADAIAARLTA